MNVSRGLFRTWVVVRSVLWVVGATVLGWMIVTEQLARGKYQYVIQIKKNIEPWKPFDKNVPFYDFAHSPSERGFPVQFSEVGYEYVELWNKLVSDGKMERKWYPDRSSLYLDMVMHQKDRNQRWARWWSFIWPWIVGAIAPVIGFLFLGAAMVWVGRGFKSA